MIAKNTSASQTLTPEELSDAIEYLCGPGIAGTRTFAAGTGLAYTTVWRYLRGEVAVPRYVALIVEMLTTLRKKKLPLPDGFSNWVIKK